MMESLFGLYLNNLCGWMNLYEKPAAEDKTVLEYKGIRRYIWNGSGGYVAPKWCDVVWVGNEGTSKLVLCKQ